MKTSDAGRKFIESHEGYSSTAYRDQRGILTIGYGTTRNVTEGQTCTQEEADAWIAEDLATAEAAVSDAVKVILSQPEFDALVSLTYNIGVNAFRNSTLLKLLNNAEYPGASNQFLAWSKTNGVLNQGLLNRRRDEMKMFDTPEAE